MNPLELISELCQLEHRITGSPNEHKTAKLISEKLKSLELNPFAERFRWQPSYSWSLVLHFFLLVASELALHRGYNVLASLGALIVMLSLWGEVSGRFIWLGKIIPKIESTNVIARLGAQEPSKRLVIIAHIDTAKSGMIFHPYITRFLWENTKTGVLTIPFFASALLVALIVAKASGANGFVINALFLLANIVLGISALLLIERELSGKPICGANDNASGVAVALEVAKMLKEKRLKKLEVVLAFTGAGDSNAGGSTSLLKNHPDLVSDNSYIINIDSVGKGELKVSTIEGPVLGRLASIELACLVLTAAKSAQIAIKPERLRFTSDAYPALVKGARAVTIFAETPEFTRRSEKDTPENLEKERISEATKLVYQTAMLIEGE